MRQPSPTLDRLLRPQCPSPCVWSSVTHVRPTSADALGSAIAVPTPMLSPGQTLQERRRSRRRSSCCSDHTGAFSLASLPPSAAFDSSASTRSALDAACIKLRALRAASAPGDATGHLQLDTRDLLSSPHLTSLEQGSGTPSLATPSSSPEVRKKSGALVKSSLKATGPCLVYADSQPVSPPDTDTPAVRDLRKLWSKSLPATPSSKAVHFHPNLEQVKVFHHRSRPSAVSSDATTLADLTEAENESDAAKTHPCFGPLAPPFGCTPQKSSSLPSRSATTVAVTAMRPPEIILRLPNFPSSAHTSASAQTRPVFLERLALSDDLRSINGTVQVGNLAFEKWVAVRYTYDSWTSVQEVGCTYQQTVKNGAADRFEFGIRLNDLLDWQRGQGGIHSSTMHLCVRFSVAGAEHWDNNAGRNYQLDFITRPASVPNGACAPLSEATTNPYHRPAGSRLTSSPSSTSAQEDQLGPGRCFTYPVNGTDYFSRRPRSHAGYVSLVPSSAPIPTVPCEPVQRARQAPGALLGAHVSAPVGEIDTPNSLPTSFNSARSWGSGWWNANRVGPADESDVASTSRSSLSSLQTQPGPPLSASSPADQGTLNSNEGERVAPAVSASTKPAAAHSNELASPVPISHAASPSTSPPPEPAAQVCSPSSPTQSMLSPGSLDSCSISSPSSSLAHSPCDVGPAVSGLTWSSWEEDLRHSWSASTSTPVTAWDTCVSGVPDYNDIHTDTVASRVDRSNRLAASTRLRPSPSTRLTLTPASPRLP